MTPRAVRPFFYYYGGKHRIAPRYPRPVHRRLVEAFAGSAGYATRYAHHQVELYDVDPAVIGAWRYLITVKEREFRMLPGLVENIDDLPVNLSQEAKWLIGWWLGASLMRPRNTPTGWGRSGTGSFWCSDTRDMLAAQLRYIRHWEAHEGSYDTAVDGEATWFIDPPYDNKAGKKYTCHDIDYAALGWWCRSREGQVIVCEQQGADWLPFEPLGVFQTAAKGRSRGGRDDIDLKTVGAEAFWTNDP